MSGLNTDVRCAASTVASRRTVAVMGAIAWLGAFSWSACEQAATATGTSYGAGTTAPPPTSSAAGSTVTAGTAAITGTAGAKPGGASGAPSAGAASAAGSSGASAAASGSGVSGAGAAGSAVAAGAGGVGTVAGAAGVALAGAGAVAGQGGMDSAGVGAAGVAGGAAGGASSTWKRSCKSGDVGPCASFIPSNGMEVELGPYGAVMEPNVGKGFAYTVASGDSDDNAYCRSFSSAFGEDPSASDMLLDTGSLDFTLYTVYRPAQFKDGEKLPIITWGNGTCAQPEGYATLLRYVASHGFLIVAPNSRFVGSGAEMRKGLDFIFAANEDPMSPYYQRLDTTKVGAMGHSQGGQGTVATVSDARVKAVIIWNMGTSTTKPFLAVSGDTDVTGATPSGMGSAVNRATVKAAFLYYHMVPATGSASGHLTLMTQPERVVEPATAWWKYILNDDAESKAYFAGTSCKLCMRDDEFEFGQKGIE